MTPKEHAYLISPLGSFEASDNEQGWYDIEHAKDILGYAPQDHGEDWAEPPKELVERVNDNRSV